MTAASLATMPKPQLIVSASGSFPGPALVPADWLAMCAAPTREADTFPSPAPLSGPDLIFTLALGAMVGASIVAALWLVDRWRNRPILLED